tara:strand:- start:807 stop:2387 length:1581 start_codon:yes stop_codon:yes gene_type:complete
MDIKELIRRFSQLKTTRGTWESHWQEIADYVLPRRADVTTKRARGDKRTEKIFDSTAINAAELLASSLHGMLTNAASPWFMMKYKDSEFNRDDAAMEWLEEATHQMYIILNRSNFQQEVHELYADLITFGTGSMMIEKDEVSGLRFSTRHISEIYIQENEFGRVDTVYRKFKMSARAAFQMFGEVSSKITKLKDKNPYDEIELLHIVLPRDEFDPRKIDAINKPFASIYCDPETTELLGEGGYDEFPYVVPRFLKSSVETYGRSPAMVALADIKMINKMSETIIKAAQKTIDPPLLVPDDGFMLPIRTVPGGLNFYRSGSRDRIEPLNTNPNIGLGVQYEDQRRDAIRKAFYVDQLLLAQRVNMTATEVLQRNEEKMRMLAPVLGRLQSEMLKPLIDRCFNIMLRMNMFPVPPESLQGKDIDIEYTSPLARSQRGGDITAAVRALEILSPLSQLAPVFDYIDPDKFVRHITEVLGVPAKILRSDQEVGQLRQQRAAAQQAQAEAMQQMQEAEIANKTAPMVKAVKS